MATGKWNCSTSNASSSLKLLVSMVPLILIVGLVFVLGSGFCNWDFTGKSSPLFWNSVSSSASSFDGKQRSEGVLDLRSEAVVEVGGSEKSKENKAIMINASSSPTIPVQENMQTLQQSNESLNVSIPWPKIAPGNETYVPLLTKKQQKFSILDRTEARLLRARAAIREARNRSEIQDPDYIPVGPMYRNAKAFHRSYIEMEKQFKVFVYEEGEPPVFHNGPCKSIYSMEGNFIHAMEMNDKFRTRDSEKAHVFFLPFSVVMMVRFVYIRDSHDFGPIRKTVTDYINVIGERYPYWNRSLGADHFMLACHDWGPEASFSTPYLHKNSIRVLCNANTSERFNPAKDVSFPEINLQTGSINGFLGGPSASKRSVLAFFAGGLHGHIRAVLLEHWENKDEDIQVRQYLPKGVSYYAMLRKSKFCLCPSGYEVASPRVVEAIYTGCVPVLISEHYVPPFNDVLNWKSFSVEISLKDIPNLKQILMSISPRQYIRMQRRVEKIRRHFEVHSPPKRFDVFHMILHSVWLRRLNFRVNDDQ